MISAAAGALINGATSIIGQGMANKANRREANAQRQFNWEQWNREAAYNDAQWDKTNEYNLRMWNMQNEYNSPQAQMARLREAGLNPNLMYGKGNVGNAGSVQAQGMRSPDMKGYNRAQVESVTKGLDVFGQYQRFKQMEAQTDNVRAQTRVAEQEALNKAQNRLLMVAQTGKAGFDLQLAKDLRNTSLEAAKLNLEELQARINNMSQQQIESIMNTKLKAQQLKDLKMGFTSDSPWLLKMGVKTYQNNSSWFNQWIDQFTK